MRSPYLFQNGRINENDWRAMRHAYCILAHDYPKELSALLQSLDHWNNDIYVHLDAKSTLRPEDFSNCVTQSNLIFIPRIPVTWGGSSMIDANLNLLNAAHQKGHYRYYHLMSGLDYPLKSQSYIQEYYKKRDGLNFIGKKAMREDDPRFKMRYQQYHFLQDPYIGKKRSLLKYIDFASCYVQRAVGIRRFKGQVMKIHQACMSITNEVVDTIVKARKSISRQYKWTYCGDEVYLLSTIWNDLKLRDSLAPQGNLYYVQWEQVTRRDRSPRALTMQDYAAIQSSDLLFGRKIRFPQSTDLVIALNKDWNNEK